jgi:hypothetical protein
LLLRLRDCVLTTVVVEFVKEDFPDIYPLTIINDRYNGWLHPASRKRGKYMAFNMDEGELPWFINGRESDYEKYWKDTGSLRVIGLGETPNDAVMDLWKLMQTEAYKKRVGLE